jgi:type VI secretion system ImpC/EvpB family protein/type VI secretion system ImpB/VipA family protein
MSDLTTGGMSLGEHLLLAVVFTDVAGFSARVGQDESRALLGIRRDFELMAPIIARFNGRLLKTMGDGQLIYFQCAASAVNCAVAMQQALSRTARAHEPADVLQHRIGIHLGDVYICDNDVHGNGVNIAARLQGRAEPGGICISQTVYDVVKQQLALKVNYLGAQELKNISESVHIYHLLIDAAPESADSAAAPTAPLPAAARGPGDGGGFTLQASAVTRPMPRSRVRPTTEPLHVAMVGDFSGRSSRGVLEALSNRRPVSIDIDNMAEVMGCCHVSLPLLHKPGECVELHFKTPEDFHPDRLCRLAEPLDGLLQLRKRLLNPKTAAAASIEARDLLGAAVAAVSSAPVAVDSALVEQLLAKLPAGASPARANPTVGIDALISNLFRSCAGSECAPVADEWIEPLDLELTRQLRAILHHPDFQQMEAAWSAVAMLVNAFGAEDSIKLSLIDVSKAELMADLETPAIEASGFYKLLAQQPPALLVANFTFGDTLAELDTMERLSRIAAAAKAPVIAAAHPHLTGCESFSAQPDPQSWSRPLPPPCLQRWQALRQSPEACYLGLAAPRFLLRQPYGQAGDAIDLFPFEELSDAAAHESYLWGNPAFLCGYVLCQAFLKEGWNLATARSAEVGDMPVHSIADDDETTVKSWAETWLSERAAGVMLKHGLIPVMAMKDRNAVRLCNLQSIASPPQPLPGLTC